MSFMKDTTTEVSREKRPTLNAQRPTLNEVREWETTEYKG